MIDWEQKAVDDMLNWAHNKTNAISYTILCDHANGQGSDALHALLAALVRGAEPDEIMLQTRRLVAIGSTSGWDMLAGLMVGLSTIGTSTRTLSF
jgi:hypothetical protein